MTLFKSLLSTSLVVLTGIFAVPTPGFAGSSARYDYTCLNYDTYGSTAVCQRWKRRALGLIKPGRCYEWEKSRKDPRECIALNRGESTIRVYPYAGRGAEPVKKIDVMKRDLSSSFAQCDQWAARYFGHQQSYWATLNSYAGGSIPERYRAVLKYKLSEYCKAYYQ